MTRSEARTETTPYAHERVPALRRPLPAATSRSEVPDHLPAPYDRLCRCAREARSQSLHILAIALLQIPVAVLPCGSMCAELFLELGWGAPFPASVHHRIP